MKTFLLSTLAVLLLSAVAVGQKNNVLTNEEIISLSKGSLGNAIIIKKIQASPNQFDLSGEGLSKLSAEKVSQEVILAMMDASANTVSEYHELTSKLEKPGIYLQSEATENPTLLESTMIDKTKSGSMGSHVASTFTASAKKKVKAMVAGPTANLVVTASPIFLFYFGEKNKKEENPAATNTDSNNPLQAILAMQNMSKVSRTDFSKITSPNEIRLVKVDQSKHERSFVTSANSGMTRESGIDTDYVRDFKFEKLAPNLYKVYFEKPLAAGEYLFFNAGDAIAQGSTVYDFSVK